MSKHSGTLRPEIFDCEQAALELRTFSDTTGRKNNLSADPGFDSIDRWLLQRLRRFIGDLPIRLVLRGREELSPAAGRDAIATVSISDCRTLARLLFSPEIAFGDAYTDGRIVVDGDLVQLMEQVIRLMRFTKPEGWFRRMSSRWLQRVQANTIAGSARNIHHHYDLTTDFYRLWLDSRLVYTCAYFPSPSVSLEQAQIAKMDHVCRKLQLQPGETVVEAGCGWGALALHMAKNYGVKVRAFNISREQILVARDLAAKEGLSGRVEFIEDDYRNISGRCDVFASVGMLEHVGVENYRELGRTIHRTIGDSGRGLLHFIGRNRPGTFSPWIRKRIFPGAYTPALSELTDLFEPWNFSVLDVENLRLHYARTLEHWLSRFEAATGQITKMFGPEFVRAWRLYLAGSTAAFRVGTLQLFQVAFAGPACRQIPWTRAYLYAKHNPAKEEPQWIRATS
ncbi:MAG TPA: cyclopropane-fatty-acyl-phospholipid synthase family protein [Terriglobales bacterium]|nr:cyclopropane-fatty-acyl-phospholipid synthase family protein [Terriglobales bacterium]